MKETARTQAMQMQIQSDLVDINRIRFDACHAQVKPKYSKWQWRPLK